MPQSCQDPKLASALKSIGGPLYICLVQSQEVSPRCPPQSQTPTFTQEVTQRLMDEHRKREELEERYTALARSYEELQELVDLHNISTNR
jgi:hypothetical protein